MKIDLGKYKSNNSKVYSGRERGRVVREKMGLDNLDANDETVEIHVPEDTLSINTSFFLSVFGKSIRKLGEKKFRQKYLFECGNEVLRSDIEEGIKRALKEKSVL